MKKLLAILLALMMVFVCTAALAAAPTEGGDAGNTKDGKTGGASTGTAYVPGTGADEGKDTVGSPRIQAALNNGGSITINKVYALTILDGAKLPETDIKFTPTLKSITDSTVTVANMAQKPVSITFTPDKETVLNTSESSYTNSQPITIQFPEYPEVGVYTYEVVESGTAFAGVTYSDPITMKVTVIRIKGELKIAGIAFRVGEATTKLQEITNKYEAGTLEVKKLVTGNMGELDRDFTIKVTFTSSKKVNSTIGVTVSGTGAITEGVTNNTIPAGWETSKEVTFTLRANDTITFTNVPAGVAYEISETDYTKAPYSYDEAKYIKGNGTITAGVKTEASVTNNKDVVVDTGVTLDSAVYMLIMALALAGFVVLKIRRREDY